MGYSARDSHLSATMSVQMPLKIFACNPLAKTQDLLADVVLFMGEYYCSPFDGPIKIM